MTAPPAPPEPPARTRSRVGLVTVTLISVAMLAMWGYVVYLAFGPGRADPPDKLDDPAFATAAEERCSAALDRIASLPRAADAQDPVERAAVLDVANGHLTDMLDELDGIVPAGEDGELVTEWLADWRIYITDREAFADELRRDAGARLLVTAKSGQQITDYLDAFAQDNDMPACSTPLDA
jgi:hypothetical protein